MKNLAKIRARKKLSQEQLAKKLSIRQANVSRWERGLVKARLTAIRAVAKALNVTQKALMG